MAAGVNHRWDERELCWSPVLDADGASSVEGIAIAGDGAGIGGAQAAIWRGRIAARSAIAALAPEAATKLEPVASLRAELARAERGRAFIDTLFQPARQFRIPAGDTIVCRCEEIPAARITALIADGVLGPNQMKFFTRCGMGPCQGRLCGLTVSEMFAAARGVSPGEVGHYRLRTPVKPVTVAEMAAMPKGAHAEKAVVRL